MKKARWLLIIVMLLLTGGCWQYQELDHLAMVSAIGIDKVEDEYLVTVQVINVRKLTKDSSAGSNEAPITIYEGKAKTLGQAINKVYLQSPKDLYLGHIEVVVIGEDTAKIGLREYIDFLLRDREARKVYPVVIAKEAKANEVLKVLTSIETLPSTNLTSILENAHKNNGTLTNRTFDNILICLYVRGRHPVVPAVEIIKPTKKGDETDNISSSDPETKLIATGPAVLLDDKLAGYFNDDQGLGYNIIRKRVQSSVISFPCDNKGNYASVKIDTPNFKLDAKVKNNSPLFNLSVEVTATISDYNCDLNLKKPENVKKVEEMANKRLTEILNSAIKSTQKEYKSDVLGFGEVLYRNNYKYWEKVEKDWDKMYQNVEYKIEAKTTINNTGSTTIPAKEGGTSGDH